MDYKVRRSSYEFQRPETIRAEPQDMRQLIIAMLNRMDLLVPNVMKENFRNWVAIRSRLGIIDAIVAPHCPPEYNEARKEIREKMKKFKEKDFGDQANAEKYMELYESWIEEISKHLSVFGLIPAQDIEMQFETIEPNWEVNKEFLTPEEIKVLEGMGKLEKKEKEKQTVDGFKSEFADTSKRKE